MEKTGKKISHVTGVLARSVRIIIENILREGGALQEIRMRIGQPLTVMIDGEEQILPLKERAHIVTKEEIKETIEYMSRYSLYAYENELRQGFLTLEGGHRVGVAGKVIVDRGKVKNIQYISSLNIRIAHEVIGCADELIPYIDELKSFSMEHFGALPHLTIARDDRTAGIDYLTNLSIEEYDKVWSQFDSGFWKFKKSIFGIHQGDYCYAGLWSMYIDLTTGEALPCYCGHLLHNAFEHPEKPLDWCPVGKCPIAHCYHCLLYTSPSPRDCS